MRRAKLFLFIILIFILVFSLVSSIYSQELSVGVEETIEFLPLPFPPVEPDNDGDMISLLLPIFDITLTELQLGTYADFSSYVKYDLINHLEGAVLFSIYPNDVFNIDLGLKLPFDFAIEDDTKDFRFTPQLMVNPKVLFKVSDKYTMHSELLYYAEIPLPTISSGIDEVRSPQNIIPYWNNIFNLNDMLTLNAGLLVEMKIEGGAKIDEYTEVEPNDFNLYINVPVTLEIVPADVIFIQTGIEIVLKDIVQVTEGHTSSNEFKLDVLPLVYVLFMPSSKFSIYLYIDSLIGLNDIYFDLYIECGLSFIPSEMLTLSLVFKPHPNESLFSLEPDYIGKGFETRLNLVFTPIDKLEINFDYFVKLLPEVEEERFGMGVTLGLRWYIIKQPGEEAVNNNNILNNPNNETNDDDNTNNNNNIENNENNSENID